ncbi:alpha-isopropylmalate synthase regulatory domain-containing protein [Escherichia coli]
MAAAHSLTPPVSTKMACSKNRENYEIMTPESIGLNQIQLNLTSRSGRAAVKDRMDEMGYKESEYNLDNLYDAFLKLADKKGQVFDYDLEALAFIGKQQEEPEHSRLDYFSVQSGSNDIATAAVKLACGEEVKAEAANGNGPVDCRLSGNGPHHSTITSNW